MAGWKYYGGGSYNDVYVDDLENPQLVFKIAKNSLHPDIQAFDMPKRSVRLWNLINKEIQPPAYETTIKGYGNVWICPFIKKGPSEATDEEIKNKVIDIFSETKGRVLLDAVSPGNMIKTAEGTIVCVDVAMAVQMDFREELLHSSSSKTEGHISTTSLKAWEKLGDIYKKNYFPNSAKYSPKAIEAIKALLFIRFNRPDITNADFLKTKPDLITILSKADNKNIEIVMAKLQEHAPINRKAPTIKRNIAINLSGIKQSLISLIDAYISSQGSLEKSRDKDSVFVPSLFTSLFKNTPLTVRQVTTARIMVSDIEQAGTLEKIEELVDRIIKREANSNKNPTFFNNETAFYQTVQMCKSRIEKESNKALIPRAYA